MIIAPLLSSFHELPIEGQEILKSLYTLIDEGSFTGLYDFAEILDSFFLKLLPPFEQLLRYKKQVLSKMKQSLVDRAVQGIFEDLERLPQSDREKYTEGHKEIFEAATQEVLDFA